MDPYGTLTILATVHVVDVDHGPQSKMVPVQRIHDRREFCIAFAKRHAEAVAQHGMSYEYRFRQNIERIEGMCASWNGVEYNP